MKKVIFCGSKKIGYECLRILWKSQKRYNYKIIGCLTNKKGNLIKTFCRKTRIKIIPNLNIYNKGPKIDLLISVQYHKILKKHHLKKSNLNINLHMAPLPDYRGCNQFSFAIVNKEKKFGTTIHLMDEKIDHGPILAQKRFPIRKNEWVSSLYKRTADYSIKLFRQSLPLILNGLQRKDKFKNQKNGRSKLYLRKDIIKLRRLSLKWPEEKIGRYIRATLMPGFPSPYFTIQKKKFYLSLETNTK